MAPIARLDGYGAQAAKLIAKEEALLPAAAQGHPPFELRRWIDDEEQRLRP
jgi:hypothetical protein